MEQLHVVNLDEIADRWQIPVDVIQYFIVVLRMPVTDTERGQWFADHSDLIIQEKQKAFEAALFPKKVMSPTGPLAKIS